MLQAPLGILPLYWPFFTFHVMKTIKINLILIKKMKIANLRVKRVNPGWYCFRGPDSASLK